jgi:hypothetical protein
MADTRELLKSGSPAPAAEASIRVGQSVALDAKITSAGLLSVAVLVTGILLSTAVIVLAATREKRDERG